MNREILFRAKRIDDNKWIYGYYYKIREIPYTHKEDHEKCPVQIHHCIVSERESECCLVNKTCFEEINVDTVCQYTGLKDIDGNKIFEGDILNVTYSDQQGECHYVENYVLDDLRATSIIGWLDYANELKIVGNIFDNPELLN